MICPKSECVHVERCLCKQFLWRRLLRPRTDPWSLMESCTLMRRRKHAETCRYTSALRKESDGGPPAGSYCVTQRNFEHRSELLQVARHTLWPSSYWPRLKILCDFSLESSESFIEEYSGLNPSQTEGLCVCGVRMFSSSLRGFFHYSHGLDMCAPQLRWWMDGMTLHLCSFQGLHSSSSLVSHISYCTQPTLLSLCWTKLNALQIVWFFPR